MASTVRSMICCTSTVGVDSSWPATSGTGVADGGGTAAIPGAPVSDPFGQTNHTAIIAITVPTIPSITFIGMSGCGGGSGSGGDGDVLPHATSPKTVSKSGTLSTGRTQHSSRYFVSLATVRS